MVNGHAPSLPLMVGFGVVAVDQNELTYIRVQLHFFFLRPVGLHKLAHFPRGRLEGNLHRIVRPLWHWIFVATETIVMSRMGDVAHCRK